VVSFGEGDLEGKQLRSAVYQETRKTTTKIGFYEWLKKEKLALRVRGMRSTAVGHVMR